MPLSRSASTPRHIVVSTRLALACVFLGGFTWPKSGRAEPPVPRPATSKPSTEQPPNGQNSDLSVPSDEPRMVLLRGGRTVQGVVTKNGENYIVRKPTGEMFLPATQVLHIASDLRGLYRQLRDTLPGESPPDEHFALAKWCLEKQLLSESRLELVEVLRHDSTREDARRMIARLDDVLDPADQPRAPTPIDAEKAILRARYGVSDLQSLGGLTREQSRVFSTRVLPILLNNCSTAGCHGGDASTFRLERLPVSESGRKLAVTRNLERVLGQLDRRQPSASLLLSASAGPHARAGRVVIPGPKGDEQLRTVRKWVESLADTSGRNPRPDSSASPDSGTTSDAGLASHRPSEGPETTRTGAAVPLEQDGSTAEYDTVNLAHPAESDSQGLTPPRRSPFDPTDFNAGRDQPR